MAGTFYLLSSVVCYLSFGNDVPGNVLEGFDNLTGAYGWRDGQGLRSGQCALRAVATLVCQPTHAMPLSLADCPAWVIVIAQLLVLLQAATVWQVSSEKWCSIATPPDPFQRSPGACWMDAPFCRSGRSLCSTPWKAL